MQSQVSLQLRPLSLLPLRTVLPENIEHDGADHTLSFSIATADQRLPRVRSKAPYEPQDLTDGNYKARRRP